MSNSCTQSKQSVVVSPIWILILFRCNERHTIAANVHKFLRITYVYRESHHRHSIPTHSSSVPEEEEDNLIDLIVLSTSNWIVRAHSTKKSIRYFVATNAKNYIRPVVPRMWLPCVSRLIARAVWSKSNFPITRLKIQSQKVLSVSVVDFSTMISKFKAFFFPFLPFWFGSGSIPRRRKVASGSMAGNVLYQLWRISCVFVCASATPAAKSIKIIVVPGGQPNLLRKKKFSSTKTSGTSQKPK